MPADENNSGRVSLVTFRLDDRHFALHLSVVDRVLPAAAPTPLPGAPPIVLGVLDVAGAIVPVVDIRQRFRLPPRDIELSDRIIVARTERRTLALIANTVNGVIEVPADAVMTPTAVFPGPEYVEGVVQLADGLVLIHNLETFLSLDEEQALDQAITS